MHVYIKNISKWLHAFFRKVQSSAKVISKNNALVEMWNKPPQKCMKKQKKYQKRNEVMD